MNKYITTVILGNKAVPFSITKPFDLAFGHYNSPPLPHNNQVVTASGRKEPDKQNVSLG
jgi:hypothetical protein